MVTAHQVGSSSLSRGTNKGVMMLVLLDFDGVINAVSKSPPRNIHPLDTWNKTTCIDKATSTEYPIMYSDVVVNFINDLSINHDVVWLTTWRDSTEQFVDKLGFNNLPFVDESNRKLDPLDWWKYGIVKEVAKNKPFVWIDDEFRSGRKKEQAELSKRKHPYLCVGPVITHGLTIKEMRTIKEFCAEHD